MVKIILLYVFFIGINFGWGMTATALVESNEGVTIPNPLDLAYVDGVCFLASEPLENVGEPACQITQGCPASGEAFDDEIHSKLCEVGIRFPDALQYDASPQSPDVCDSGFTDGQPNDPSCNTTTLIQRNVTMTDGSITTILVDDGNQTQINPATTGTDPLVGIDGGFLGLGNIFNLGESFSFITDISNAANFAGTLILNTFTGGFILDVLGTGIVGVQFPTEFLIGIKILIGLAVVSWFSYLIISKQLF